MRRVFPYDVLTGDVGLTITKVLIDGKPLSTNYINPDLMEVDFAGLESAKWEQAVIEVSLTGPELELTGRQPWEKPTGTLQLNCGTTNTRQAVKLDKDPQASARWVGSMELDREDWYGRATLRAFLHATVDGIEHRIIGVADDWTLSFNDIPPSPVNGSITVTWSDFATDEAHPYLSNFAQDPCYLRLDPDDPTLFLNRGFEGLEALLVDRKHRPRAEKALHDSTRANMASDVWSAMFVTALEAVESDPETGLPDFPREDWQTVVLKTLLARIYRDLSPHDALVTAVAARNSAQGSSDLIERLIPAASGQVRLPHLLRNGIALLEKDAKDEEAAQ
ncbi:hypothetical protein ACFWXI_10135 [[Kitasatospora] papulosa]|uniref:hypothetical protein n=1 Tax=Streptomyces TaxID=1883 RepID=UPI00363A7A45